MQKTINQKIVNVKTPISQSTDIPFCQTCNSLIYDLPYRFLVVKDEYGKHEMLSFHYFFPCWDVDFVCQNLSGSKISKAGFICDSSIKNNPKAINNFRKNLDLWDV